MNLPACKYAIKLNVINLGKYLAIQYVKWNSASNIFLC